MAKKIKTLDLVQNRAWAITQEKLVEINAAILARLNGVKLDPPEAITGAAESNTGGEYEVIDGVAVIDISGTLFKRANMFMSFSGGTSYELLKRDIADALADSSVGSILLNVDSPGGTVDGCYDLAQWIRTQRGVKPIVAFADGLMCSAAYLIASQADEVLASQSALVGSIGVIAMYYDYSEQDKKYGVKRTAVSAGAFKDSGGDHRAMDEKDAEYLQGIVDDYHALFVADVVAARGNLTEKQIRATEAKVFVGAKAVEIGLADAVATFEEALNRAREQENKMDKTELKSKYPGVYAEVVAEGRAQAEAETQTKIDTALAAETKRCAELVHLDGGVEATAKAITEKTGTGEFAKTVLENERKGRTASAAAAASGLDSAVESAGAEKRKGSAASSADQYTAKVKEWQEKNPARPASAAHTAITKEFPALHEAWLKR